MNILKLITRWDFPLKPFLSLSLVTARKSLNYWSEKVLEASLIRNSFNVFTPLTHIDFKQWILHNKQNWQRVRESRHKQNKQARKSKEREISVINKFPFLASIGMQMCVFSSSQKYNQKHFKRQFFPCLFDALLYVIWVCCLLQQECRSAFISQRGFNALCVFVIFFPSAFALELFFSKRAWKVFIRNEIVRARERKALPLSKSLSNSFLAHDNYRAVEGKTVWSKNWNEEKKKHKHSAARIISNEIILHEYEKKTNFRAWKDRWNDDDNIFIIFFFFRGMSEHWIKERERGESQS